MNLSKILFILLLQNSLQAMPLRLFNDSKGTYGICELELILARLDRILKHKVGRNLYYEQCGHVNFQTVHKHIKLTQNKIKYAICLQAIISTVKGEERMQLNMCYPTLHLMKLYF